MDLAILLAAFPLRSFDFGEQNHYPKDAVFHQKSSEQYGQVREPPAKPGAKLNVPYHPLQLGTLPPHVPSEPRSASNTHQRKCTEDSTKRNNEPKPHQRKCTKRHRCKLLLVPHPPSTPLP